jgi:hypothetical protein
LLFGSTLVALLGLECGLRILQSRAIPEETAQPTPAATTADSATGSLTPIYVPSSTLGWTLAPNAVQRFRRQDFDTTVRSNRLGFRGPEIEPRADGLVRYAVLGDSYGFGWGVEEEETYAARLEALLRADSATTRGHEVQVVNGALPGFGTFQRLRALETLLPLGLDGVVIEFSVSNDVVDDWRAHPYVPDHLGEYQARGTQFTPIERFVTEHSRLAHMVWRRGLPLRLWLEARRGANLRRTAGLYDELIGRARAAGLSVVVLVNASRFQVLGEGGGGMSWIANTGFGHRPNTLIEDVIARHGLPWVDGEEVFRAVPPAELYLGTDVHWTPRGHALVAAALDSVLRAARAPGVAGQPGDLVASRPSGPGNGP